MGKPDTEKKEYKEYILLTIFFIILFAFCVFSSIFLVSLTSSFSDEIAAKTKQFVMFGSYQESVHKGYSSEEFTHLKEVRSLVVKIAFIWCFLLLAVSLFVYFKRTILSHYYFEALHKHFLVVIALLFILKVIFFEEIFLLLHKILFVNQWSFSSDSLLIQLFPGTFWFYKSIETVILSYILFIGLVYLLRLKSRN